MRREVGNKGRSQVSGWQCPGEAGKPVSGGGGGIACVRCEKVTLPHSEKVKICPAICWAWRTDTESWLPVNRNNISTKDTLREETVMMTPPSVAAGLFFIL